MQKGSYLGQVFAVFVNMKKHDNPYEYVKNVINYYHEVIKENNNIIEEAYTYEDLIRIKNASKFIAFLSVEELGILEGDITRLDELYNLGVRMMTLTWNYKNCIGHPNIDLENENINLFHYEEELGLTEFGKKVIKRMNELGIIIDVSHLSDKGVEDVLKISSKPICASHSSSRILNKCARNLSEELLVKLNEKEALIGVNYCYDFVHINNLSYVNSIIEHFKNYKETINIESIAFGSDFDGIEVYEELKDCSKMNTILSELKNIFSKKAMQKICYNNFFELVKKNQA